MNVQLRAHVKPAPVRRPNEYDEVIEALTKFEDGSQEAVITQPAGDIQKHTRRFRNAAKHAGYRSREVSREADEDGNVSVALTISKRKTISDVTGEDDDDTADDTAE
ncbi:hypothetical protein SEA_PINEAPPLEPIZZA_6 [Microbacterium phage PineapplePizza]|uniref:Uncharacterized protein n=1 Tax=Microbacterium phage PineapplePizza TaxID=2927268 RepID=A0A976YDI6_9CAUD|nr:hypothetical protein QEH41_gp06 [Microbacterium phage PineapplePizza]UVF60414.1 hypothetical protein SEA_PINEAPPLEPIZZA_6 [Microbacterium phage PineapplePizza]